MSKDIVIKPRAEQLLLNPVIEFTGSSGGTAKIEVTSGGNIDFSNGSPSSTVNFNNSTKHAAGILANQIKDLTGVNSINITGNDVEIVDKLTVGGNEIVGSTSAPAGYHVRLETSGDVTISGNLKVIGNDIKSSSSATAITLFDDNVTIADKLTITGNQITGSAGGNITLQSAGDVRIAGNLTVIGNNIKSSTGETVITLNSNDVTIADKLTITGNQITGSAGGNITLQSSGDVRVAGDLTVNGNNIKSSTATAITLSGANTTIDGNLIASDILEKTVGGGVTVDEITLKDDTIGWGTNGPGGGPSYRRVLSIPLNAGDQTTTSASSITLTSSDSDAIFTSNSEFSILDIDVGDYFDFYSHIQKGETSSPPPGASAHIISSIVVSTSQLTSVVSEPTISKISFLNDHWYEASHIVTGHVTAKTTTSITLALTSIGCNLWNSDSSSTSPTIVPRLITLSVSPFLINNYSLFFNHRCQLTNVTSPRSQIINREVDKTTIRKF
jgi:hypothetical protein